MPKLDDYIFQTSPVKRNYQVVYLGKDDKSWLRYDEFGQPIMWFPSCDSIRALQIVKKLQQIPVNVERIVVLDGAKLVFQVLELPKFDEFTFSYSASLLQYYNYSTLVDVNSDAETARIAAWDALTSYLLPPWQHNYLVDDFGASIYGSY